MADTADWTIWEKPAGYERKEVLAELFNMSVRRVEQLSSEGVITSEKVQINGKGKNKSKTRTMTMYRLIPSINQYIKYLQDKVKGKGITDRELELKEQKLTAEIALKESQAELQKIKTEIAAGEYISIEDVKIDYSRFFNVLKRFILGIPSKVGGRVSGYVDPIEARAIEKDLDKEIKTMLTGFVVAGVVGGEKKTKRRKVVSDA